METSVIITLTPEQILFLHQNASTLTLEDRKGNEEVYLFMPYWFRQMEDRKYEVWHLDALPHKLKKELSALRYNYTRRKK